MQQPPEPGVVFSDELSQVENRHLLGHDDNIRLEEKRKPLPGRAHGTATSRGPQRDSRCAAPSLNEGLMLEKNSNAASSSAPVS